MRFFKKLIRTGLCTLLIFSLLASAGFAATISEPIPNANLQTQGSIDDEPDGPLTDDSDANNNSDDIDNVEPDAQAPSLEPEPGDNQNSESETTPEADTDSDTDSEESVPTTSGVAEVDSPAWLKSRVVLYLNSTTAQVFGVKTTLETKPFVTQNTTMLPLRYICSDILKATTDWDNATNIVRVSSDQTQITIDLNSGQVWANGEKYSMAVKPTVINNRTYVPLRLIAEKMNCDVYWESAKNRVIITLPDTDPIAAPTALAELDPIVAGQTLTWTDLSTDPAGYSITAREWTITDSSGETVSGSDIVKLMQSLKAGSYELSYKVKNSQGVWSDPYEMSYEIGVNQIPQITKIKSSRTRPQVGQEFSLEVMFENESWEATKIEYTYSWEVDGQTFTESGEPTVLFAPGKYTITATVRDGYGQTSEPATLILEVSTTVLKSEAQYRFAKLVPGEIYLNMNNNNFYKLPELLPESVERTDVTLIDSNSPEKITQYGILYQDTVSGAATIHYHHQNNMSSKLKIYVIVHNKSNQTIALTLGKQGFAGPSSDPLQVGYQENRNYLSSANTGATVYLAPGRIYLLNSSQTKSLNPGTLQSGMIDITASGELTVTVAAMKTTSDYRDYEWLQPIAAVGPQTRGSYANAGYEVEYELDGEETVRMQLGYPNNYGDMIEDYQLVGVDALTGNTSKNAGNYGVVHRIKITATENIGILLNPRGTIYRGALLWNDELIGLSTYSQIQTPRESVVLGVIYRGQTITLTYITPDGSDSPVLLTAIPEDEWKNY